MSVATLEPKTRPAQGGGPIAWLLNAAATTLQFLLGLFGLVFVAWVTDRLYRPRTDGAPSSPGDRLARTIIRCAIAGVLHGLIFTVFIAIYVATALATGGPESLAGQNQTAQQPINLIDTILFIIALVKFKIAPDYDPDYRVYGKVVQFRLRLWRGFFRLLGTAIVLALSLLPLSTLLLAFPALVPQESVLTDAVSDKRSWLRRTGSRIFAVLAGFVVLIALLAVSVEVVTRMPLPERGSFATVSKAFMPAPASFMGRTQAEKDKALAKFPEETQEFLKTPLHEKLPAAMVEHWPFVVLVMYGADLLVLLTLGRVPLAYNLRNVRVRWKTNLMTAVAFMFVIGLMVFLLAFVNGMNNLTAHTGVPGNVFVLSEGSTDELFSNLPVSEVDNVERVVALEDEKGRVLNPPVRVQTTVKNGKKVALASRETYYAINQPVLNSNPPRRRFVQLRSVEDPEIAAEVHNIQLYPGGRWFNQAGVDDESRIQCVLGEGIAGTLAEDAGKKRLVPGDKFQLGDMEWLVIGIMKSEGTTFGSEIWVRRFDRITQPFGKTNYTTLVMRTDQDTLKASRAMADHLTKRYTQQKLKAFAEPDYYAELTKTNDFFLTAVVIVAVVMAIGGVFGMMTTMFASIAQRIKDIGVLRLLGFKRWQVTVSFMLESLTLAVIGGALGCLVAYLAADGRTTTSTMSGGGGGPGGKSFALTIDVDAQVVAMGLLFTLAMGRLGGLVPALSAMRIKVLESLR